jgi:hypothetical protein
MFSDRHGSRSAISVAELLKTFPTKAHSAITALCFVAIAVVLTVLPTNADDLIEDPLDNI